MIFQEFAVEPELLSSYEKFRMYWGLFGWEKGRLICEYPSKWRKLVLESLNCPPVKRKTIVEKLRSKDKFINRKGTSYSGDRKWAENVLKLGESKPFNWVLLSGSCPDHQKGGNLLFDDDLLDASDLPDNGEPLVDRTFEGYTGALSLLLTHSRRILVIDPYLNFSDERYSDHFLKLFSNLEEISPFAEVAMELHTSFGDKKVAPAEFNRACKNKLSKCNFKKISFSSHFWAESDVKGKMHNRYILTDKWGVVFPYGTDADLASQGKDDIKRLSKEQYEERWRGFAVDRDAFEYIREESGKLG